MATLHDVDASELIEKVAEELKKNENIKPAEWANYVKTGAHRERAPLRKDWWYIRAAAILRTSYNYSPIGVEKLRIKYGGKKRRGHQPPRFYKGSGSIIRKILQQLEKVGFLKKEEKLKHKGRRITPQGKSFLDKIATQICKGSKKPEVKPKVEEKSAETKKVSEPKVETKRPLEVKKEEKPKIEEKTPSVKELVKETKKEFKDGLLFGLL